MTQFITYHLADSLPRAALQRMEAECAQMPDKERQDAMRERLDEYLDAGTGGCILRDGECAGIVQQAFLHGEGKRYQLLGWTIMPNHVHVLIRPSEGWDLARIVHSWKSFTAHAILKTSAGAAGFPHGGPVWHREYWDRFIRDEGHFQDTMAYIAMNPVRAGICAEPTRWPNWSGGTLGR